MTAPKVDMPTSTPPVLEITDGRATIRLARPREHNRLEPIDLVTLRRHFDRIDADPSVRILVLTGTGKSFSSGFHLGAFNDDEAKTRKSEADYDPNSFESTVNRLEALRVPTIAALNGGVYGGATDLVLACDFRIGVEGMRLFMPAARLGIVYYASGLRRYVTRLGLAAAKRLFLTAATIDDKELLAIGYVDELVPVGELTARVDELAATIAGNAPLAVEALKWALNHTASGELDAAELNRRRAIAGNSADHKEALAAWAEKREPRFQGR